MGHFPLNQHQTAKKDDENQLVTTRPEAGTSGFYEGTDGNMETSDNNERHEGNSKIAEVAKQAKNAVGVDLLRRKISVIEGNATTDKTKPEDQPP